MTPRPPVARRSRTDPPAGVPGERAAPYLVSLALRRELRQRRRGGGPGEGEPTPCSSFGLGRRLVGTRRTGGVARLVAAATNDTEATDGEGQRRLTIEDVWSVEALNATALLPANASAPEALPDELATAPLLCPMTTVLASHPRSASMNGSQILRLAANGSGMSFSTTSENLPSSSSSELIVRCRALQVQARALALEPARHLLPDALDRIRGRRHGLSNLISGLPG